MYHIFTSQGCTQLGTGEKSDDRDAAGPPPKLGAAIGASIVCREENRRLIPLQTGPNFLEARNHLARALRQADRFQTAPRQEPLDPIGQISLGNHGRARRLCKQALGRRRIQRPARGGQPNPAPREVARKVGDDLPVRRRNEPKHTRRILDLTRHNTAPLRAFRHCRFRLYQHGPRLGALLHRWRRLRLGAGRCGFNAGLGFGLGLTVGRIGFIVEPMSPRGHDDFVCLFLREARVR